jgi:hypothetical protein
MVKLRREAISADKELAKPASDFSSGLENSSLNNKKAPKRKEEYHGAYKRCREFR